MPDFLWDLTTVFPDKTDYRARVAPNGDVSATDLNALKAALEDVRTTIRNGLMKPLATPPAVSEADEYNIKSSTKGRMYISESGGSYRPVVDSDEVRDVRAFLSTSELENLESGTDVNATAAMQAIFDDLGTTKSGRIYTPPLDQLMQIEETCEYIGNASRAFSWKGKLGNARGATQGSGFKFVGSLGGTMFDLRGANNCEISDVFFHGNELAKYPLRLREYRNDDVTLLSSSANINVYRCTFYKPSANDVDSACVAIGQTTSGNTFQASEYRFHECVIHGSGGVGGGYGIRTLEGGNCKNFGVFNSYFLELCVGIQADSGFLLVQNCLGTNIGTDRGTAGCLVRSGADSILLQSVGLESGDPDTAGASRIAESTSANSVMIIDGVYGAFATPADGYGIKAAGPVFIRSGKLGPNYKQTAMKAWAPTTTHIVGQERHNDSGKAYAVASITTGITAGSGGPTGTGTGIVDGGVTWDYVAPLASNAINIQVNPISAAIEGVGFTTHNGDSLTTAPVYDGSNNLLTGGDYAKLSAANNRVKCRGNVSSGAAGLSAVLDNELRDTNSGWVDNVRDQLLTDALTAGVTVVSDVGGRYVVTVPYSVFATAGANDVIIGRLNYLHRVDSILGKVTAGLSGGGVTNPLVAVGVQFTTGSVDPTDIDVNGLLVEFDASAAGVFGADDAELGAQMQAKAGYISGADHYNWIRAKLTVSGGTIASLSAGSITFYIGHKRLGVA
jgi:hypothetical protein